jgi:uncharacterized repeat protein (TIGR01451 family)
MNTNAQARGGMHFLRNGLAALFVLLAGAMFLLSSANVHAAPLAGTVIGNQATATYNDAGNTARQATSNQVQTTVSQVKSFTLLANGNRTASPGQTVYYPHIITNTGNGNDTYTLSALVQGNGGSSTNFAGPNLPHQNMQYFGDNAGSPDTVPITGTPSVGPGQQFRFWVAGTVPASAAATNTATITFTASDTGGNTAPSLQDTTTVAASVITANKTLSLSQGTSPYPVAPAVGNILVTISYNNTGTAPATNLTLTDALPVGMTYVAGSGLWSNSGTALTDAAAGDPAGIAYEYNSVSRTVTAVVGTVPVGFSGNLTFRVTIDANLAPGYITNTATYSTATQASASTAATYEVLRTTGVVANGSTSAGPAFTGSAVNGTAEPVTIATAAAGATLYFTNVIWNTGNAADSFVITTNAPGGFPAGTTTTLLQSDGITSLVANTTPSVPTYAAGCPAGYVADAALQRCGYRVVLRVQLPANAPATGTAADIIVTATSSFAAGTTDTVIDRLSAVTTNFVDMTSNTGRTDSTPAGTAASGNAATTGFGATTTTVITINTVTPSTTGTTTTTFTLFVNNGGTINDTYNLTATSVPAGWAVTYRADGGAGNCSTTGAVITQITVNALANRPVCAIVTLPATTSGQVAPATYPIDFVATSATNGALSDSVRDAVTVNAVRLVTLAPPNVQQTFPGGAVTYTHILTNLGNVSENVTFPGTFLANSRSGFGWTSAAYQDAGNDGVFVSGTDDVPAQAITNATTVVLPAGATNTRVIYVRVFAPPGASAADPANVTTLTATYNATTASVTDTTTVTDGLLLTKSQRTINCDGTSPGAYTTGPIPAGPLTAPGRCLQYQIVAQNTTAAGLTAVFINDNIPGSTTLHATCAAPATSAGTISGPSTDGATGTLSVNVGAMATGASVTFSFCVRIDP